MEITISYFLARLLGLYLVIIGAALIFRKNSMHAITQEFIKSPALVLISGVIALLMGLLFVMIHNVWVMGWPVLITILAYLILLQGLVRIFFPELLNDLAQLFTKPYHYMITGIILFLIGAFLVYHGY